MSGAQKPASYSVEDLKLLADNGYYATFTCDEFLKCAAITGNF